MASYDNLNERQLEAVTTTEGPLLVLAGAGSGKTRVLTHRVAYLIESGLARPYEILAITFTNKAADEMKSRVRQLVEMGDEVWVATFHSTCVRILRRYIDRIGYDPDFTIYDTDDQRAAVRHVLKDMGFDPKLFKERKIVAAISAYKNEHITAEDLYLEGETNPKKKEMAAIYEGYEAYLKKNHALDFDDLLLKTVDLFRSDSEVLEHYRNRFRYIMVDEYQDTNPVQFELVYLLSMVHRNLMVVGDDDQSIYRFRGADIRNILEFEKRFPGTKVVKLEQNYRSTTRILDVANASIRHNHGRKPKTLYSKLGEGAPVTLRVYENANAEADEIIRKIREGVRAGRSYRDYAILYRTNAQSRLFEEACINRNVPYVIVGGVNFYQRAEIKDVIAYLKVVSGGMDDQATERALQTPRRGIGDATVARLLRYGAANGRSLMESICVADTVPGVERARTKLAEFAQLIEKLRDDAKTLSIDELLREIIEATDYERLVLGEYEDEKAEQKTENIEELISKARDFEEQWQGEEPPTVGEFLTEIALVSDIDETDDSDNRVMLFTIHGAKGLEFPTVFVAGLEEGVFPSYMSMTDEPEAMEEERRLFYVAATRAKKELHLSAAASRITNGEFVRNPISRFVAEIPEALVERDPYDRYAGKKPKDDPFGGFGFDAYGSGQRFGDHRYGSGSGDSRYGGSGGVASSAKPHTPPKATFGKTFTVEKAASLSYGPGDRVRHGKFGEGTVVSIEDGKKDYTVTVNFDNFGEKCMMASFAKLEKI